MRLRLVSLFLMISIAACTFQVDVIETPLPSETVAAVSSTSTSTPAPDHSATPLPLPTTEATSTTLPISTVVQQGSTYPIQFGPNGTYVDIIDSIRGGESKTYSVNAMKGQVMSISFHQNEDTEWAYITMQIVGADKSVLCEVACQFWRGLLPATQNYFVTVTPSSDASDFVMRVAINPPGAATQSFLYENKYRDASLSYTDIFAPAFSPDAIRRHMEPELALQFIDTDSYTHTNLSEAYFLFGSSTDPQTVATCMEPAVDGAMQTEPENVTLHGISYVTSRGVDVGAGNIYDLTYYRTAHAGTCYEIIYYIHYTNPGNYEPGAVTEFDREALLRHFDEILSTLVLK